jgi:hypothetical protein
MQLDGLDRRVESRVSRVGTLQTSLRAVQRPEVVQRKSRANQVAREAASSDEAEKYGAERWSRKPCEQVEENARLKR